MIKEASQFHCGFDNRLIRPLSKLLNGIGAGLCFLIMFLILVDVTLRYFFKTSVPGSTELVELILVGLVFLGIAYTQFEKGHINIDFLTSRLPHNIQSIVGSITYLLTLGIVALITWRIFEYAKKSADVKVGILYIPVSLLSIWQLLVVPCCVSYCV